MKKALFSLIVFLCTLPATLQAQAVLDTANVAYRAAVSTYFEQVTLKGESEIDQINDRKARNEFAANYKEKQDEFRKLIKKGTFIEHPKYSPLMQSVFEKLKKGNPSANFNEIRLLLAISEDYNAYNYGDGIVVLNLPLMIEMDNEYELAYVISHEISHQKLNHVYKSMLKKATASTSKELKKQTANIEKEKYNKGKLAENLFKKLVYGTREESRRCEHQADSLGYIYFKNAYPGKEYYAIETLRKLKDIDKPSNDSLVKNDFVALFEVNNLKFNEEWIASDIANYSYQKQTRLWDVDSLRTHPDCDLRIDFLKKAFAIKESKLTDTNAETNPASEYEYIFGLYHLKEYGKSLYFTLLKLKSNPKDAFLRKLFYDNLLKIREARNSLTLNRYVEVENPNNAHDYNQVLCLLRNIRKNELNQIIDFYKSL